MSKDTSFSCAMRFASLAVGATTMMMHGSFCLSVLFWLNAQSLSFISVSISGC